MNLSETLNPGDRVFLDTAPVIYFVENHTIYAPVVKTVFDLIDASSITAIISPVTLAECLVLPRRQNQPDAYTSFYNRLINGNNPEFIEINATIAQQAADLRSRHNLSLTDAFQLACAIAAQCQAFLTNDTIFNRVSELPIILVNDLVP